MATQRAAGYVVTHTVWNAVLAQLTDDGGTYSGAFNGSSVTGTTGSFSSTLAVTGATTCAALTASGIIGTTAADGRAIRISRSGSNPAGLSIANGDRTYAIGIDSGSSSKLVIQEDSDGSPRIDVNASANQVGFVATAGVTNANYYLNATEQPGFLAYNSGDDAGLFSGTTVDFDTEVSDPGADFASDVFTVPVTGIYGSFGSVRINNSSGGVCTNLLASLVVNGSTTFWPVGGIGTLASGERASLSLSGMLSLTAGDTVEVKITASAVGGSGFTVEGGASGTIETHWGMRLLV